MSEIPKKVLITPAQGKGTVVVKDITEGELTALINGPGVMGLDIKSNGNGPIFIVMGEGMIFDPGNKTIVKRPRG